MSHRLCQLCVKSFLALRLAVILGIIVTVAGCAVTPQQRAKIEPQSVTFTSKDGVVMVKVGSNRGNIGTYFAKWQTLRIEDVASAKTFDLPDRSPPYALYSLYVGNVPAGTYRLVKFDSMAMGYLTIHSVAALGGQLGQFSVEEGMVTDLGTLLYLRPYFPSDTPLYRIAWGNVPFESTNSLASLDPGVSASAKNGTLGWLPDLDAGGRPALLKGSESPSMYLNDPHAAKDGAMLFGEALGLISRRDSDGHWTTIDTGTLNTILALHLAGDGTIFAGSEQSLLLSKTSTSKAWKNIPFPLADASIRFIGEHPKMGYLVVAQDRRSIVVLSCKDLLNPVWSELKRIPVELYQNPAMDTQFDAFLAKDKLFVVARTVAFNIKIAFSVLDVPSQSWTDIPVDLYGLAFSPMSDGSVFAMAGPNISQHFYVSHNNGVTWDKRNSPNWMGQPVFRNSMDGYAIRIESIPAFDPSKLTNSLWKTTDGGNSWIKIGSLPNQSQKLILIQPLGSMLLVTANGQLHLTTDDGQSWALERTIQ